MSTNQIEDAAAANPAPTAAGMNSAHNTSIANMDPPNGMTSPGSPNEADALSMDPQESRRLTIQRCVQFLVHACQCHNASCSLPSCQKMKRVVQHREGCKRKTNGGCPICKQLIALCCYHAKHCQENECPVPFCLNIKHKIQQQQIQRRLEQAQLLRRRMAAMNPRTVPQQPLPTRTTPGTRSQPTQPKPAQTSCNLANYSLPSWQKMKMVVQDTQGRKRKTNEGCAICKLRIALRNHHA